jgi:TolB protein
MNLSAHVVCLVGAIATGAVVTEAALAQTVAPGHPANILAVQDAYPHVSREGRLVFQSNRVGGSKLFTSKLDGSDLRQLTTGPSEDATAVWSPDGKFVAYASTQNGDEDVWIINADGTGARNLTRYRGSDSHPNWSHEGTRIIFSSTRGDGENDDIYIINIDGSGLKRLTDNGLAWDTFASFSPDGRKILFRRLLRQRTDEGTLANSEIMVMNSDGTRPKNLSKHPWFDGWPSWSPDGKRIAFASNRSDPYQIYVMNADGSDLTQVVSSAVTDVRPQWLRDGRGLVFNREADGRIEILRVDFPR